MEKTIKLLAVIFIITMFVGCNKQQDNNTTKVKTAYQKISAQEAKKIIDEQKGYIILDVRTQEEFDEGHIENAVLIPDYEIESKASLELSDKNVQILVYCRTGRRSAIAAQKLFEMGYTDVKDFGGIVDWPYETVK